MFIYYYIRCLYPLFWKILSYGNMITDNIAWEGGGMRLSDGVV